MAALAIPLTALYFAAGGIAILVDKKRARAASKYSDDEASEVDAAEPIEDPDIKN